MGNMLLQRLWAFFPATFISMEHRMLTWVWTWDYPGGQFLHPQNSDNNPLLRISHRHLLIILQHSGTVVQILTPTQRGVQGGKGRLSHPPALLTQLKHIKADLVKMVIGEGGYTDTWDVSSSILCTDLSNHWICPHCSCDENSTLYEFETKGIALNH